MTTQQTFGLVLLGSVCCFPAWAQQPATLSERFLDTPQQTASRPTAKPQTARRQPRAVDVPATAPSAELPVNDPALSEDEALQRKISGICRGC